MRSFYSLEASRGLGCSLLLFGRPAPGLRHRRPTTRAGEGPQEQTDIAILLKDLDSHQPALDRYHSSQALPCRWPASLGCRLGVLPPMFTAGSGGAILRAESVCDIRPGVPSTWSGIWHVAGAYKPSLGGGVGGGSHSPVMCRHVLEHLRPCSQ